MSARDAESGSSSYRGGSRSAGGIGNGGVGGGMGGGGNWGVGGTNRGGAARNGGYAAGTTGLTTGTVMRGVAGPNGFTAVGRPGGAAMNPGAWGIQSMPAVSQAPMNRPAVPGLLGPAAPVPAGYPEPVIEDVPMPPVAPSIPRTYVPSRIKQIFDPPPVVPAAPVAPPSWRNPTAYPQWSTGWKNQTNNYFEGNTYPGGFKYTGPTGLNNNWSNDDTRFGIDKMARERGY